MGTNYFTFQSAATAAGNGEVLRVGDNVFAQVEVTISASATVTFEGTGYDATDWRAVLCQNMTTGAVATTATASGLYLFPLQGLLRARVRISTFGSGTITAKAVVSPYPFVVLPHGVTAAAAALADNTANPTTTLTGALAHGFDGTTWDRLRTGNGGVTAIAAGVLAQVPYLWHTIDEYEPVADAGNYTDASAGRYHTVTGLMAYNGATWDRTRNNHTGTALASAARTATTNSSDLTNYDARGVRVWVNVTAVTDTPSITVSIQDKDPISGTYTSILTSAAITGVSLTRLTVYPGMTAAANVAASEPLPRTWRVAATHADADSITYSVGYALIL